MTLYQFNMLDEMEQVEAYWEGIVVGKYKSEDGCIYECRQISDFYVEFKIRDGFYLEMKTFRNPELLDLYFNNQSD